MNAMSQAGPKGRNLVEVGQGTPQPFRDQIVEARKAALAFDMTDEAEAQGSADQSDAEAVCANRQRDLEVEADAAPEQALHHRDMARRLIGKHPRAVGGGVAGSEPRVDAEQRSAHAPRPRAQLMG